jgi:hypothetical protein
MTTKSALSGARRDGVIGLRTWEPHLEGLALPKSIESGNLSLNKAVIWWMSGTRSETLFRLNTKTKGKLL